MTGVERPSFGAIGCCRTTSFVKLVPASERFQLWYRRSTSHSFFKNHILESIARNQFL
jgi:hypothetical protein